MGRWTQFDEDSARLPEGMKRVGYDADTRQYTFLESSTGMLYESAPGNEYGILRPIGRSANDQQKARPSAFAPTDSADNETKLSVDLSVKSFEDFLPPAAITSPPPSPKKFHLSPTSDSSSGPRLPDIFRKVKAMSSTVSRMQVSPADGSRHSKSSSVLSSSTSRYRDSPSPPPYPSHRHRGHTRLADTRQEEDRKGLLRSKTMSSTSSSSSRSHHGAAVSRSSTRASRASAVSTTSTITPMGTR